MGTSSDDLVQQALDAGKLNDMPRAKELLIQAVNMDRNNARAWYLLSQIAENNEQAIYCLEKALELQPGNLRAAERLNKLKGLSQQQPKPQPAPPQVIVVKEKKKNKLVSFLAAVSLILILCFCLMMFMPDQDTSTTTTKSGIKPSDVHKVTYKITGSTSSASITVSNAQGGTEQYDISVPTTIDMNIKGPTFLYLSAQNNKGGGSITCEILIDGEVLKKSTSSGAYVITSCSDWYYP